MNTLPAAARRRDLAALQARAMRTRRHARAEAAGPSRIRLWLPLTPLFWLLAPFAILISPLITLYPPFRGANPFAVAVSIGAVLTSMSGTRIHVDAPDTSVHITIL